MKSLLRADLIRCLKSRVWWISVVLSVLLGIFSANNAFSSFSIDTVFTMIPFILCVIFISLFLGEEFRAGAIRNKIVTGYRKGTVFLSALIVCMAACACLFCLFMGTFCVLSYRLFQGIPASVSWNITFGFLLATLAMAGICTVIAMFVSKKAAVAVVDLLLIFVMYFSADAILTALEQPEYFEPLRVAVYNQETGALEFVSMGEREYNERYIGGTKRKIYQLASDVLPLGQAVEYCSIIEEYTRFSDEDVVLFVELTDGQTRAVETHPYYSIGLTALLTLGGWLLFQRKDIK